MVNVNKAHGCDDISIRMIKICDQPINCQKLYGPFLWMGFNFLKQGYSHFEEAVYFLPLSSQKFLVLILSTLEGWKVDLSWPWSHPVPVVLNTEPLDLISSPLTTWPLLHVKPLSIIYQNCLNTSTFPDIRKKIKHCSCPQERWQIVNNYKPVFLLPVCSIFDFLDNNSLLSEMKCSNEMHQWQ